MKTKELTIEEVADVYGGGTPRTKIPEYWGGDIKWLTPAEVETLHMAQSLI